MGRKSWRDEFNSACLLGEAAGILQNTMRIPEPDISEPEKERRKVAIEVFKKLAPSNVNIGGQPKNPLGITLEIVLNEDKPNQASDTSV